MNVSELIVKLKELKEIHGDWPVFRADPPTVDAEITEVEYVHVPLLHELYFRIT